MSIFDDYISLLTEGVPLPELYDKYYATKVNSMDDFSKLNNLDPTASKDAKGKYLDFIVKIYKKDYDKDINKMEKDFDQIKAELELFSKRVKGKDINLIKNYEEFKTVLAPYAGDSSLGKSRQEIKKDEADTLYDKSGWKIIVPKTENAAKLYGKNTKWCTSAEKNCEFKTYNNWGKLYIIIDSKTDKKWQFQFVTRVYKDAQDDDIDIGGFDAIPPEVINYFLSIDLNDRFAHANFVARLVLKKYAHLHDLYDLDEYYLQILLNPGLDRTIDDPVTKTYAARCTYIMNDKPDILNEASVSGITPLMRMLSEGYYTLANMALDKGADKTINAVTNIHQTALFITINQLIERPAFSSQIIIDMIKRLLDMGADKSINIKGPENRTCLSVACRCESKEVVDLLLDHGADIDLTYLTRLEYEKYVRNNR